MNTPTPIFKADRTAADRLLKRATDNAVHLIRSGDLMAAEVVLVTAGFGASMLLDGKPA